MFCLIPVIDTEGIFRRSGSYARINALKQRVNSGEMQAIDFKDEDTFVVAGLLKAFLRDLQEPLLTYELYDEITKFLEWTKEERSRNVKLMLREKLPIENYELFKYIVEFLVKVSGGFFTSDPIPAFFQLKCRILIPVSG